MRVKFQEFEQLLAKNQLPYKILIFYGEETYFLRKATEDMKLIYRNASVITFKTSQTELSIITNEISTPGLFSPQKLIIIDDDKELFKRKTDEITKLAEKVAKNCILIFVLEYKLPPELSGGDNILFVECLKYTEQEIRNDIQIFVQRHNKVIEPRAISLLIYRCSGNASLIFQNLERLVLFGADKKIITSSDVLEVVSFHAEYAIFNLIDCILNKNIRDSLKILSWIIKHGETATSITNMIGWQLRKMIEAKKLSLEITDSMKICDEIGIKFYRNRFIQIVNMFSLNQLISRLKIVLSTDLKLKTYSLHGQEENLLQEMIINLINA